MSKHRALVEGGPIPQDFLDAIQEFMGSQASPNLVVTILNPTTLRIPASADNGQVACAINGRWRYVSANVDCAAPGGLTVGDNPIFVAASDNSFAANPTPPPREIDSTDYTFRLLVLPVGSTPSGVGAQALWRQIGVATWSGTAFTAVKQTVGALTTIPLHAGTHIAGGSDAISAILSAKQVWEPGIAGQIRAGRVFVLTDFTTLLGSGAPQGLWNLSDLTDISGNSGNLTNKGAVTFGSGITGAVTEAAIFHGGVTDSLYIHSTIYDLGGYGSWGCWFRTAKQSTTQTLISKYKAAQRGWYMEIINDVVETGVNLSGVANGALTSVDGATVVSDNRWHFAVGTYDGTTLSLYVDGKLERQVVGSGPFFQSGLSADLNIGSDSADAGTNASNPMFGRIDEAFASDDVLSPEQVRMLYAAKLAHGLVAFPPIDATLSVRRRRKGGTLTIAPFSTQPLHLYDFTAGSLVDVGSLGNNLTNNGAAVAAPGADGAQSNAFNFVAASNQYLSATDAGLPAGVTARTMGCWFRSIATSVVMMAYGQTDQTNDVRLLLNASGQVQLSMGAQNVSETTQTHNDGLWHHAVAVIDPNATDALLYKLYVDGKLVASSASALVATVLGGAGAFHVGRGTSASGLYFNGGLDSAFITGYAATADEVAKWFAVGSQQMPASPKDAGDHVEGFDATNLYLICDTLESQHLVDIVVSAA